MGENVLQNLLDYKRLVDSVVRSAVHVAALGILDSMSASGWNEVYPARTSFVWIRDGIFSRQQACVHGCVKRGHKRSS